MMKKIFYFLIITFLSFLFIQNSYAQNWSQIIKTVSSTRSVKTSTARSTNDNFGCTVAIDGDYAVVGAYREDNDENGGAQLTDAGSVIIYKKTAGVWAQLKKIVASDRAASDYFGASVSISGNTIVVGAYLEDEDAFGGNPLFNAGSAYIFYKDQGGVDNWGQVKKIVASDRADNDNFGTAVAISGDNIIVGAYNEDDDASGNNPLSVSGSAYIFYKDQGGADNWGQVKKIVASDRGEVDIFGRSVSIYNDVAIIGASFEDEDEADANTFASAGSAYIFYKDQGGADNWGQVKKIVAADRGLSDLFGNAVAISNSTIIVGAYSESENANGNYTVPGAGSAYFFKDCITTSLATTHTSGISKQIDGIVDYHDNNCNLIASVESGGGLYTLTGQTKASVWLEAVQPSTPYNIYARRHHEIDPLVNPATSTANIFLYFTQQEFNDFNAVSNVKIPMGPGDLSGIGNILIEQREGVSSDGSGLPSSYPGSVTTISPHDIDIIWNGSRMHWQVAFEVTGFGGFFLKTISYPLPVRWLQVSANLNTENKAVLNWRVQEQNAANYIIEKSSNGTDFTAIGIVNSKGDGTNSYSITEATALSGTWFYRIKQIQKGGQFQYSTAIKLSTFTTTDITVFPNPVKDVLIITTDNNLVNTNVTITDMTGKIVNSIQLTGASSTINMTSLANGIYILKFENGISKKIIKQ